MTRKIFFLLLLMALTYLVIMRFLSFTVNDDQRAVIFKPYRGGLDKKNVIEPGTDYTFPWNDVYIYKIAGNRIELELDALDKDANLLTIQLKAGFSLIPEEIGYLHEVFGQEYKNRMVIPELRSVVRRVVIRYSAKEILSTKTGEFESAIVDEAQQVLEASHVQLHKLSILSIELPQDLKEQLEEVYRQKQLSEVKDK